MSVPIVDATAYSIRPLLYALLAATDPVRVPLFHTSCTKTQL
jgi:hypothetical protein